MIKFVAEIWVEKKTLFVLVSVWFVPSCVFLFLGWSELFSAFGSVGVIVAVVSVSKLVSTMSWAIRTERNAQLDDRISVVSMSLSRDMMKRAIAAGRDVENQSESLTKVEGGLKDLQLRLAQKKSSKLNERNEAHEAAVLRFDTAILSIATLQWGFGAWLSEFIKCGSASC